jgi:predicted phage tail protein
LLPQPDTAALPALQERVLVRFTLPVLAGAARYRAQLADQADGAHFDRVLAELTSASPELRFQDLPDGDYVLRVRAIDGLGLEGRDADHRFRLKARPEAPLPAAPQPGAVTVGSRADFSWAASAEAARYRLQLAATPDFKAPLRDVADLRATATQLEGLQPGTYHWRLASLRADGDPGPWGDARRFEVLAPPPPRPPPEQAPAPACLRNGSGACVRAGETTLNLVP